MTVCAPLGPLFPAAKRLRSSRGQLLAAAGGKFGTRVRAAPVDGRLGEGLFPYKERDATQEHALWLHKQSAVLGEGQQKASSTGQR